MPLLVDGRVLVGGKSGIDMQIQESWRAHVLSFDRTQAQNLFEQEISVLEGNCDMVEVSTGWSPFTVCVPANHKELGWFIYRTQEIYGMVMYSYEDLFDDQDEYSMKSHFEFCQEIGLRHKDLVLENGKKYLIGYRVHKSLMTMLDFEDFAQLFYGPVIDSMSINIKYNSKDLKWSFPAIFREKSVPSWKSDFFFAKGVAKDAFFAEIAKPKFLGGTIEMPNHEQITVLIASGAINQEVLLDDGRIVILKGTEQISSKSRTKLDIEGNPKVLIDQQIRETLVYGLDMTNGEFFKLSSGQEV